MKHVGPTNPQAVIIPGAGQSLDDLRRFMDSEEGARFVIDAVAKHQAKVGANETSMGWKSWLNYIILLGSGVAIGRGVVTETEVELLAGGIFAIVSLVARIIQKKGLKVVKPIQLVLTAMLALVLPFMLVGCATPPDKDQTIAEAAWAANLISYTATAVHLSDNPGDVPYFQAGVATLDALIRAEDYQPSSLASALKALPFDELRGSKGTIYVTAGVMLFDRVAGRLMDVESAAAVKQFAVAIRSGIAQALAEHTPTKS